jgi:hypothetical protein
MIRSRAEELYTLAALDDSSNSDKTRQPVDVRQSHERGPRRGPCRERRVRYARWSRTSESSRDGSVIPTHPNTRLNRSENNQERLDDVRARGDHTVRGSSGSVDRIGGGGARASDKAARQTDRDENRGRETSQRGTRHGRTPFSCDRCVARRRTPQAKHAARQATDNQSWTYMVPKNGAETRSWWRSPRSGPLPRSRTTRADRVNRRETRPPRSREDGAREHIPVIFAYDAGAVTPRH